MNGYALAAGVMSIGMGVAHSLLGERFIIIQLLRRDDLPPVFGSVPLTKRIIRFAWHLTTVLLFSLGALLFVLSNGNPSQEGLLILRVLAATFLASALVSALFTRGKHFSWFCFLVIAVLAWMAAR